LHSKEATEGDYSISIENVYSQFGILDKFRKKHVLDAQKTYLSKEHHSAFILNINSILLN